MSGPEAPRRWYRIALADEAGVVERVAASATHLGAALALATARRRGAWPIGAATASADEVPLGDSIGRGVVSLGTAGAPPVPASRWPVGVLPRLGDGPVPELREGYARHPDPELLVIEAVLHGARAAAGFLELVERLPRADNVEIALCDHFETGGRQVWLTPRLDVRRAVRFLDDHDLDLLDNGHVELSVYLRAEHSTLRLTEHKTLVWLARDRATEARLVAALTDLGLTEVAPAALTTPGRHEHLHYRPADSRGRDKLATRLGKLKLAQVGPGAPAPRPPRAR